MLIADQEWTMAGSRKKENNDAGGNKGGEEDRAIASPNSKP